MSAHDTYKTPLDCRYSSQEMMTLFGDRSRYSVWRKLWYWLAQAQKEVGLKGISDEALAQMANHLIPTDEDFAVAAAKEKECRHDVMAHAYVFGQVAPAAAPIIHLGATSCFVTDNCELILMKDAMDILLPKLAKVIYNLSQFALKTKDVPTLGYTHLQAAQLISVGRRAAQWVQDLMMDLKNIESQRKDILFRGTVGTTGTQASFLEIFHGDASKIDKINQILCQKTGFSKNYDISAQTYSRKVDLDISNVICGLGSTAIHITNDIRHLAGWNELEEPFEKDQVGSSAMAYKRNPMRCERICSLGRKLRSYPINFADTYSDQWLERTLDDSAIRGMDIPETMLLADAILMGLDNVSSGLVIYRQIIYSRIMEQLPFMATENIIMKMVGSGASRQEAHEQIRVLSHQASDVVKNQGKKNDLIERIKNTKYFEPVWDEIDNLLDSKLFIGRSVEIVGKYCGKGGAVEEKLAPYMDLISKANTVQLNV